MGLQQGSKEAGGFPTGHIQAVERMGSHSGHGYFQAGSHKSKYVAT